MTPSRFRVAAAASLLFLGATLALSLACGGKPPASPSEAPKNDAQAEVSDLDRPVAEILAAVCEHKVPQYTCDECRYEVGVAKAPDELFDPAKGGVLRVSRLGEKPFQGGKEATGEVRLNEERAVFVSPLAPGVVRGIRVDIGSRVAQGQVLFEVDSAEFRRAKADCVRAAAVLELARATEAREAELFARGICPRKDLQEAEASLREAEADQRAAVGTLRSMGLTEPALEELAVKGSTSGLMPVTAPFPGVVLERSLSLGALAQPGDRAVLLADTSTMWVLTALYETDVPAVSRSQEGAPIRAEVRTAAYPDRVFVGTVQRVGGTLDESTRTAQARVVVDNPDGLLRAGMFARVRLLGTARPGVLALPEEAVLEDEGREFVFVRLSGPYFIRRPVKAGPASEGWRAIQGGVEAGEEVVTAGAFLLKSDVLRSKMGAGCAD